MEFAYVSFPSDIFPPPGTALNTTRYGAHGDEREMPEMVVPEIPRED